MMVCRWARSLDCTVHTIDTGGASGAWTLFFSSPVLYWPCRSAILATYSKVMFCCSKTAASSESEFDRVCATLRSLHFSFPSPPSDSPTATVLWLSEDLKCINPLDLFSVLASFKSLNFSLFSINSWVLVCSPSCTHRQFSSSYSGLANSVANPNPNESQLSPTPCCTTWPQIEVKYSLTGNITWNSGPLTWSGRQWFLVMSEVPWLQDAYRSLWQRVFSPQAHVSCLSIFSQLMSLQSIKYQLVISVSLSLNITWYYVFWNIVIILIEFSLVKSWIFWWSQWLGGKVCYIPCNWVNHVYGSYKNIAGAVPSIWWPLALWDFHP